MSALGQKRTSDAPVKYVRFRVKNGHYSLGLKESANSQKRTFIERERASEYAHITKIRLPDGCGGETITKAAQFGYDRHGFEGYLGNVGYGNLCTIITCV